MSNSYTPGPPSSGNIFQRSSSIDDETEIGPIVDPAPSRSIIVGNEPRTVVSERNLDGEAHNNGQVPSRSDVRRGGWISDSGNTGFKHQSDAPGISGNVRANLSQPGQEIPYSVEGGQAPGLSGLARQNHSESAPQPSPDHDPSDPQEDYAGVSLVGKKFKEVNPTAYYVEK